MVGLAIDLGIAYGVKAKLNAAVDAAAIAALRDRTSSSGTDSTARDTGTNFFNANFPNGYMGVSSQPTPQIDLSNANGSWVVTVTASAASPAYFSKVLGWNNFTVGARSVATKPSLDLVLVIDCTGSLQSVFSTVKARAKDFVGKFNPNDDRVGLISFATGAVVDVPIRTSNRGFDLNLIKSTIDGYDTPHSNAYTCSEEAMRTAWHELNNVQSNVRSANRVIVFFSDGAPNTFNGLFPLDPTGTSTVSGDLFSGTTNLSPPTQIYYPNQRNRLKDNYNVHHLPATDDSGDQIHLASDHNPPTRYLSNCDRSNGLCLACDANKAARNMLENVAAMARKDTNKIAIYSLGLGTKLDDPDISEDCPECHNEKGSLIMKRIANTDPGTDTTSPKNDTYDSTQPTGLYCHALTIDDLGQCFDAIANAILRLSQ
jgi:Flp pilus assembly protein TadG